MWCIFSLILLAITRSYTLPVVESRVMGLGIWGEPSAFGGFEIPLTSPTLRDAGNIVRFSQELMSSTSACGQSWIICRRTALGTCLIPGELSLSFGRKERSSLALVGRRDASGGVSRILWSCCLYSGLTACSIWKFGLIPSENSSTVMKSALLMSRDCWR